MSLQRIFFKWAFLRIFFFPEVFKSCPFFNMDVSNLPLRSGDWNDHLFLVWLLYKQNQRGLHGLRYSWQQKPSYPALTSHIDEEYDLLWAERLLLASLLILFTSGSFLCHWKYILGHIFLPLQTSVFYKIFSQVAHHCHPQNPPFFIFPLLSQGLLSLWTTFYINCGRKYSGFHLRFFYDFEFFSLK